jgi:hypothetical protein
MGRHAFSDAEEQEAEVLASRTPSPRLLVRWVQAAVSEQADPQLAERADAHVPLGAGATGIDGGIGVAAWPDDITWRTAGLLAMTDHPT